MSNDRHDVYPIGKKNPNLPFHPAVRAGPGDHLSRGPRNIGRYNGIFAELFEDACLVRTTVEARAVIETYIEMDAIAYKPLAM